MTIDRRMSARYRLFRPHVVHPSYTNAFLPDLLRLYWRSGPGTSAPPVDLVAVPSCSTQFSRLGNPGHLRLKRLFRAYFRISRSFARRINAHTGPGSTQSKPHIAVRCKPSCSPGLGSTCSTYAPALGLRSLLKAIAASRTHIMLINIGGSATCASLVPAWRKTS